MSISSWYCDAKSIACVCGSLPLGVRMPLFSLRHQRMQVRLAPLAVLLGHAIGIVHGDVGFVLADDPAFVVSCDEPLGDLVEVELAGAHLRPGFGAVAGVVL